MVARIYLQHSKMYQDESEYWLSYAHKLACDLFEHQSQVDGQATHTYLKRIASLRAAFMIDLGHVDDARELLQSLASEGDFNAEE